MLLIKRRSEKYLLTCIDTLFHYLMDLVLAICKLLKIYKMNGKDHLRKYTFFKDPRDGIGEVACSGRNVFMGYLRDATRTRETFDRGFWLLTGDMATIEDGFITIKGRIKDVIITSGGKNIAPYPLEKKIKGMLADLVSHCMVVGNKQTHLTCLITVKAVLDPATLEVQYNTIFINTFN